MTEKVLQKIEGTTFKKTLDYKKRERKNLMDNGYETQAYNVKTSIAGYVQAMRDCGVITERERSILFIYYATC